MSARREATVTCNHCFSSFSVVNTRSIRFGRSQAAYFGWVYDGVNDFCCEAHRDEFYRRQSIHLVDTAEKAAPSRGVLVIHTKGLPKGYVPPSASLRGQDILDRTPVSPEPEGRTGPVIVKDVND